MTTLRVPVIALATTVLTDPSRSPSWPYQYTLDATSTVAGIVAAQAGPN